MFKHIEIESKAKSQIKTDETIKLFKRATWDKPVSQEQVRKYDSPVCSRCDFDYIGQHLEVMCMDKNGHCQICQAELSGKFADGQMGRKDDSAKPRYSLLPAGTVNQVVQVLKKGAIKYSAGNWKHVPDARTRYYDAAMRHIDSWWQGDKVDDETGLPHLAHAVCCLLFLMWFDNKEQAK